MKFIHTFYTSILFVLFGVIAFSSCKQTKDEAANWPVIKLPEGADTSTPYWKGIDLEPKAPIKPLPVKNEMEKFLLPPGYKLEAVLTEPKIQQPAAITFDGNGRMYVLELRSYMLTADSKGTLEPVSGISRWEDVDNDGVYEKGGLFVDSLVFPRFVLPVGPNSILTMESNADNVYKYTDTNGDGKADKKEFFTDNFGRAGNVEHQQAFLYWGMDNWFYSTVNPFRVRETAHGVIRESTASNGAQWGITHDDDGKLWFQGGSNGLPSYFQFPVHYGDYIVSRDTNFAAGFDVPWGAPVLVADMQGGMGEVRMPEGTLARVTGASGNDIFRGHRLPKELVGQYFYGEPVARIVRQVNPVVHEGLTTLYNVYQEQKSEFIRSTDPLFRPVDMATAPDGTMYIVDMYHGIIQEGEWTPVGSYLRAKIEQYQLDKVVSLGRIWRLTHTDMERDKIQPHMYDQTSAELLGHLEHPNGWWRDMAQQILVQRKDTTVTQALIQLIHASNKIETKFHALWVLEGLGTLPSTLVKELMKDENPRMRTMAMWVSESIYKAGDKSFDKMYLAMMTDRDINVKMRAMMTGRLLKIPGTNDVVKNILKRDTSDGVRLVGKQVLEPRMVTSFFGRSNPNFNKEEKALVENGAKIFSSLCATCHGQLGNGTPAGPDKFLAPSFIASARVQSHPDYVIKTLLHGVIGDLHKESYTGIMMAPMGKNNDEWIASVASFIRTNFENESSPVTPEYVAKVRQATLHQTKLYKFDSLWSSIPKPLTIEGWKMTANHTGEIRKGSTASPRGALTFEGWTSGVTQQEGMWYTVELPQSIDKLIEIQFKSLVINRGFRDTNPPIQTYPKEYNLEASLDGKEWKQVINHGVGKRGNPITISFEPVQAKFLRITLTKSESIIHGQRRGQPFDFEVPWTMREFKIYGL